MLFDNKDKQWKFEYTRALTIGLTTGLLTGLAVPIAFGSLNLLSLISLIIILGIGAATVVIVKVWRYTSPVLADCVGVGLGAGLVSGVSSIAILDNLIVPVVLFTIISIALIVLTLKLYWEIKGRPKISSIWSNLLNKLHFHVPDKWHLFIVSLCLMAIFGYLIVNYTHFPIFVFYMAFVLFAAAIIAFVFGLMQGIFGKERMAPAKQLIIGLILLFILSMSYFWGISTVNINESLKWMIDGSNAIITGIVGALAYNIIKNLN